MQFGADVSYAAWNMLHLKSDAVWGPQGVRNIINRMRDAGMKHVNWRVQTSGCFAYPTKVEGADWYAYHGDIRTDRGVIKGGIDYGEFDPLAVAVEHAHSQGMKIYAWFDQEDTHGHGPRSQQGRWSLEHPQFYAKLRGGVPMAPPSGPHLSLSYPEVVEFRCQTIAELATYGFDALFLVYLEDVHIGYEEPVVESFMAKYGENPSELDPTDERWLTTRGEFLVRYLEAVRAIVRKAKNPFPVFLEPQGIVFDPFVQQGPSEPTSFSTQIETILGRRLCDGLCLWLLEDVKRWLPLVKARGHKILHRFRIWEHRPFDVHWQYKFDQAIKAGVDVFLVNESICIDRDGDWPLVTKLIAERTT